MRITTIMALVIVIVGASVAGAADSTVRSLDGSGNNSAHPDWGQANRPYVRVAAPNYADGVRKPVAGPPTRYVSNRIFNDTAQNIFSENGETQWGFVWGQFLDHTFGLRQEAGGELAPIAFDTHDPLEQFTNDLGAISFNRTPAAPGTGNSPFSPRQQINTVGGYIDASSVYGDTASRLEWLRVGPVDGSSANNEARLLLPNGFLATAFQGNRDLVSLSRPGGLFAQVRGQLVGGTNS